MIIETTFNDNDFTHILDEYWSRFRFVNYYYGLDRIEDPAVYRDARIDMESLIEKAVYNDLDQEESKRFLLYIKTSILEFIKDNYRDDYIYLSDNFKVAIKKSVEDKNYNGEIVYYFLTNNVYITM
jgi:hypothetical protein